MHPALSVIFFTVSSGAGLGLIAWIGLGAPMPGSGIGIFLAAALAFGLTKLGLLSSTFHLGHPERALRAFTQWRSSWLSREGIAAVVTLLVFGVYVVIWLWTGERHAILGILSAIGAALTVFTTSMIYAQLRTVPAWYTVMTPICYGLFALASGACLAAALNPDALQFGGLGGISILLIALAGVGKFIWFERLDGLQGGLGDSSVGSATGLGTIGAVRLLEAPHSGGSYLTHEMVHKVGRKRARALRRVFFAMAVIAPVLLTLLLVGLSAPGPWLFLVGVVLLVGLFAERWLFFAEARHAVSLYYS